MVSETLQKSKTADDGISSKMEIDQIIQASSDAFEVWKNVSFSERGKYLVRMADLMEKEQKQIARLITEEMGKVISQSLQEVEKCVKAIRFYAEKAEEFLKAEIVKTESHKSYIAYQPLGPVLAVMPWNFPFWQVIRFAAPALMAGNTGILKHASNVPGCARKIQELFDSADLPKGVWQTLFVRGKDMDAIVEDTRIRAVTLTGSEAAGSKVAEVAGRTLKKTVLELGGSDPFVVLEDADLNYTANVAVKARMVNTGQSCIAAKRFIVVEKVYDEFVALFKKGLESLKSGDPFLEDVDYGPLAKPEFAENLHSQVLASIEKGAEVVCGGNWDQSLGAFYPATILTRVRPGMPAYEEEFFGPVASIIKVKDEEEAIKVANDTKFGLGSSVWTRDIERGEQVALQIDAGMAYVNKMVASDPNLPFGGVKSSGYGRELSYLGIREFTNIKTVNIDNSQP